MTKITLTDLANLQNENTAVNAINNNNAVLETAFDNTLSRDGTAPNQMQSTLDMNSNRIINLPAADSDTQPVRKAEFDLISNGYLGNNILLGTANEVTVSSGLGTTTFSLPSTLNLSSKTVNGDNFPDLYANLPVVLAWENGVPGDGTDQTVALQAIVDSLTDGGTIYLQSNVILTSLNLTGKVNITFKSRKGGPYAAGNYSDRARLTFTNGAVAPLTGLVDMTSAANIIFEDVWIYSINAAFNGVVVKMGTPGVFSYATYNKFRNCAISTSNASAIGVLMSQVANTCFQDTAWTGPGIAVQFPDTSYTEPNDFATVTSFINCNFLPSGTQYPVKGSPGGCNFIGCLWEPGNDGMLRSISTSTNRYYDHINLIGNTAIDASLGSSTPFVFPWGRGLCILGGNGGAPNGYMFTLGGGGISNPDPGVRGVSGVFIGGHSCTGCVAMVKCAGTIADQTNVRGIVVQGNAVQVGTMLATSSEVQLGEFGPNGMYGGPIAFGASKTLIGWPTYANNANALGSGLIAGQEYIVTATGARSIVI